MLLKGISLSLLSVFMSVVTALIIALFPGHTPVISMLFMQSALSLIVTLVVSPTESKGLNIVSALKTNHYFVHLIRAILGLTIYACYYESLHLVSPLNSSLLINSAPLFVPVFSFLIFRKKIIWVVGVGVILGFVGIYMILNPTWSITHNEFYGYILALFSGICFSLTLILVKYLKKYDSVNTIIFYYNFHGFVISTLLLIFFSFSINKTSLMICIIIALVFCIKQYALNTSVSLTSPVIAGMLNYLTILILLLYGVLINNQAVHLQSIIGMALVILGAFIAIYQQGLKNKAKISEINKGELRYDNK